MELKDVLHFYINAVRFRNRYVDYAPSQWTVWSLLTPRRYDQMISDASVSDIQVELRPLSSMTEEEMTGLLLSMIPPDMDDKPDADEHIVDMFYNDGALQVDGDVAVGANYSCRCYEGQIAILHNGDIEMYDEDGKRERAWNQSAAFQYLLSLGFDLFNLIPAGLALDTSSITGVNKE